MFQRLTEQTSSRFLLHALQDMDRAIISHTKWLKRLHGVLICTDHQADEVDLENNAHHLCEFGKWYYGDGKKELSGIDIYENIGELHRAMHGCARTLLQENRAGDPISTEQYNNFMDKAIEFKLEVRRLQHDIISEVCLVDHLTGAWNRHAMSLQLVQEYERVRRKGTSAVLCMMDIDHFKLINDEYGHTAGDSALQQLIDYCSGQLRIYDSIFRYGGEEFLICLPDTSLTDAQSLIDRLRLCIQQRTWTITREADIAITASFGLSLIADDKPLEDIITEADHALLCAKSKGRNQVCVWDI